MSSFLIFFSFFCLVLRTLRIEGPHRQLNSKPYFWKLWTTGWMFPIPFAGCWCRITPVSLYTKVTTAYGCVKVFVSTAVAGFLAMHHLLCLMFAPFLRMVASSRWRAFHVVSLVDIQYHLVAATFLLAAHYTASVFVHGIGRFVYGGLGDEQDMLDFVGDIKNVCLPGLNHVLFAKETLL